MKMSASVGIVMASIALYGGMAKSTARHNPCAMDKQTLKLDKFQPFAERQNNSAILSGYVSIGTDSRPSD
jgi:hypothetical protein